MKKETLRVRGSSFICIHSLDATTRELVAEGSIHRLQACPFWSSLETNQEKMGGKKGKSSSKSKGSKRSFPSHQKESTQVHAAIGSSTQASLGVNILSSSIIQSCYSSINEFDDCHNSSIPCCNALQDIVEDIFPDAKIEDNEQVSNQTTGSIQMEGDGNMKKNEKKIIEAKNESKSSFFSKVVLKYLLQDRIQRLMAGEMTDDNIILKSSVQNDVNASDIGSNTEKKKRKKKKKKKSKSTAVASTSKVCENEAEKDETDLDVQQIVHAPQTDKILPQNSDSSKKENECLDSKERQKIDNYLDRMIAKSIRYNPNSYEQNMEQLKSLLDPPENRSIDSFFNYIGARTSDQIEIPLIPVREIKSSILEKIKCRKCREDCEITLANMSSSASSIPYGSSIYQDGYEMDVLSGKEKGSKSPVKDGKFEVLNSLYLDRDTVEVKQQSKAQAPWQHHQKPHDHSMQYQDIEDGCPYALMEEGGNDCKANDIQDAVDPYKSVEERHGYNIEIIKNGDAKYFRFKFKSTCPSSATMRDFDCLLKDVIIPCGMSKIANIIPEDILQKLSGDIEVHWEKYTKLHMDLEGCTKKMTDKLFEAEQRLLDSPTFNPRAFSILQECENIQHSFLTKCREILLHLDERTVFLQAVPNEKQRWTRNLMRSLWEIYFDTTEVLSKPYLIDMWKGIQLHSNRSGSVPLVCNSPPARDSLHRMLVERQTILSKLFDEMTNLLLVSKMDKEQPVKVMLVLGEYFHFLCESKRNDKATIECHLEQVLEFHHDLICRVIYKRIAKDMKNIFSEKCIRLYDNLGNLDRDVQTLENSSLMSKSESYDWKTNMIMMEEFDECFKCAMQEEKEDSFEPSIEQDTNKIHHLCEYVKTLHGQIQLLRIFQCRNSEVIRNLSDIDIPQQLYKLCENTTLSPSICERYCGQRRIAAVLSAFLYCWFQQLCMEWHADLTRQELMTETENELLEIESKVESSKSKKKSKKKKSKVKISEPAKAEEKNEKTKSKEEVRQAIDSIDIPEGSEVSGHEEEKKIDPFVENIGAMSEDDLFEQVGVTDGGRKISAVDFLCSRYFDIIESEDVQYI